MSHNIQQKSVSETISGVIHLFGRDMQWEHKISQFILELGESFLFDTVVYVPNEKLLVQENGWIYQVGNAPLLLSEEEKWNELLAPSAINEWESELVDELHYMAQVNNFIGYHPKSYIKFQLSHLGLSLGYLIGFDQTVSRIWNEETIQDLKAMVGIFSQNAYAQFMLEDNQRKESQLQKAIESANDGSWKIDLINNTMFLSDQFKRMLGFESHELESSFEVLKELIHPEDRAAVLQVLDPYYKIGLGGYECEYRIKNKEGEFLWVLTRANVICSDQGMPISFEATNIDITSRIEYKRALAKSELKYQNLISSIHEIIFEVNKQGNVVFVNEAWERLLKFDLDQTYGSSFLNFFHPEDKPYAKSILEKPFSGKEVEYCSFEARMILSDATFVWMEVHATIYYNMLQEIFEVKGVLINISGRKQIQLEKENSDKKIGRILSNISDLIVEVDFQGRYLYVNNAVKNILGRNPDSFIGNNVLKDIHPDDIPYVKTNFLDQLVNGARRVVEQYRVRMANGEYIWIESVAQPVISSNGEKTYIAMSRDISTRKKAQEELTNALRREKELNDLKSRFITMTSHEFRTPLASISSSIELLQMYAETLDDSLVKPLEKHHNRILDQVTRIDGLLKNIDTLGQIDQIQKSFAPEPMRIFHFLNDLISDRFSDVNIHVQGSQETLIVHADVKLMDMLFYQIFSNAQKYGDGNEVNCHIHASQKEVEITISNTGLGIPLEELNQVFDSFFRAKNIVNLNIPGNGLGLTIAKEIVNVHQGLLHIESAVNQETKVKITLPLTVN